MRNRYSKYINPLLLTIDIIIINSTLLLVLAKEYASIKLNVFLIIFWCVSAFIIDYYKIYRHTSLYKLFSLLFKQNILYSLGFFTYFTLFKEGDVINLQFKTLLSSVVLIAFFKILYFSLIKNYRRLGNNYRKIVFLEKDKTTEKIIALFQEKKYLGFIVKGFFSKSVHEGNLLFLGDKSKIYNYVLTNSIDEIYATLSRISKPDLKLLTKFSNDHNIKLKLIPNSTELYSKRQKEEVYEEGFKILGVKELPFDVLENKIIKRGFDIVFSSLIILFILSWLTPILFILIKLESKGNLFFKQEREGLNGNRFNCYKFRSMKVNKQANTHRAIKNDSRITKIGKFIRSTSIDELPQFFNVLIGDMSVVGPRPHMNTHSLKFEKEVNNYIKRHAVKPGITGLAQIRGYRGEIKEKSDIENRVRLDVFYIENWSFLFDIKIIFQTVFNLFNGDENAY